MSNLKVVVPLDCVNTPVPWAALDFACQWLHANCTYTVYKNDEYGDVFPNGTATGIVGAIQRGEFDLSTPYFTPTYNRSKAITFTHIYENTRIIAITRAPKHISHQLNWNIINVFHIHIWIAFALALLLVTLTSAMLTSGNRFSYLNKCIALLTNEFNPSRLETLRMRFLVGAWLLSAVVISSSYSSGLFEGTITLKPIMPFIDFPSLIDCLDSEECQLITKGILITHFQIMPPEHRANAIVMPFENISTTMLNEKEKYLVCIEEENFVPELIAGRSICDFYIAETGRSQFNAFPMAKYSPYLGQMNKAALAIREFGLDNALKRKYYGFLECPDAAWTPRSLLEGGQMLSAMTIPFCFYGFGMGLGLSALIVETLSNRFCRGFCTVIEWYC